jgi:hypothetical protein
MRIYVEGGSCPMMDILYPPWPESFSILDMSENT